MEQNSMYKFSTLCNIYSVEGKRSEGRLKNYVSNVDIRSWSANKNERREFFQEFITHPEWYSNEFGASHLPSYFALAGALLAKKNSDIRKLKEALAANGIDVEGILQVPYHPESGRKQTKEESPALFLGQGVKEEPVSFEAYEEHDSTRAQQESEGSKRPSLVKTEQLKDEPRQPLIKSEQHSFDGTAKQPSIDIEKPLASQARDSSSLSKEQSEEQISPPSTHSEQKPYEQISPPSTHSEQKPDEQTSPPSTHSEQKPDGQTSPPSIQSEQKPDGQTSPPSIQSEQKPDEQTSPPSIQSEQKPDEQTSPPSIQSEQKPDEQTSPPSIQSEQKPEEQTSPPSIQSEQKPDEQTRPPSTQSEQQLSNERRPTPISEEPFPDITQQPGTSDVAKTDDEEPAAKVEEKPQESITDSSIINEQVLQEIRKSIAESSQLNEQALQDIRKSITESLQLSEQAMDDIRKSITESSQISEQALQDIRKSITDSLKSEQTSQDIDGPPSTTIQPHVVDADEGQAAKKSEHEFEDSERALSLKSTEETAEDTTIDEQVSKDYESYPSISTEKELREDDRHLSTITDDVQEDYVRYPSVKSEKELEGYMERPLSVSEEIPEKEIRHPSAISEDYGEFEKEKLPPFVLPEQEYKEMPDLDLLSKINYLEKENEDLCRIISELESERDNLRNELISCEELTKGLQKEDAEKHQKPCGDAGLKDKRMIEDFINIKENDSKFLKGHISKLQLLLDTIMCISKERDSLKNNAKKSECMAQEILKLKEKICELEGDLEDAEEDIEDLEEQLQDARCTEKNLREQLCQCERKLIEERCKSANFENSMAKEGGQNEKLLGDLMKEQEKVDSLLRERDKMALAMKSLEDELARMKRKEEEEKDRWKKALAELENTVKDQEAEKHRMSITLQKMIDDELITLEREAERQELCDLRRASEQHENLIEKFKEEIAISKSTYETDLSHLRGSLMSKDEDLERMITEIEKLKEVVKSLEDKRNTLEQLVSHQYREIEELKAKLEVKSKIDQGKLELSVEELEIKIDYEDKNTGSYILKASSSELDNTGKPPPGDQMLSIPVSLGPCAEMGLMNKKIYETNICNQAFISSFNCLTKSKNTQGVKLEIWQSENIILPKSKCI